MGTFGCDDPGAFARVINGPSAGCQSPGAAEAPHPRINQRRKSAARDILKSLRQNEAVGILFDQNTTRSEGVFAEFFGIPAATTPAIALFALRAGAAVIPGFLIWDENLKKHRLRLDPPTMARIRHWMVRGAITSSLCRTATFIGTP